jgi:hypothetical protein
MPISVGSGWNLNGGWKGDTAVFPIQFLVVAGGGGGGGGGSGGGAAVGARGGTGAVASVTRTDATVGLTYTILVGSGNAGGPQQNQSGVPGGPSEVNPGPGVTVLCNGGGGGNPGSGGIPGAAVPSAVTPASAPIGGPGSPTPAGLASSITGTAITYGAGSSYGAGGPGGAGNPTTGGPGARGTPGVVIVSIPTVNFPGTATGAVITTPPLTPGQTILTYNAPPTVPASYTFTT